LEASHISPHQQDIQMPLDHFTSLFFQTTHDAVIVRDFNDQRIYLWNDEAEKLYGKSSLEAIGQNYVHLLQPQVLMGQLDSEEVLNEKGQWQGELRQRYGDDQEVLVHSRQTLIYESDSKRSLVLEVNQDITESKRVAQENKEYIQLTSAANDLGIWFWNLANQSDLVTNYRTTPAIVPPGLPVDAISYKHIIHPDDWQSSVDAANQALRTHTNYTKEVRVREPDGQHWLLIRGHPIYDEQGQPLRMLGVALDITERKEAEELLQASNERIGSLLESISDAVVQMDAQWSFTYVNARAIQLLGRAKNDILGKSLWDVYPYIPGSIFETNLQQAMQSRQAMHFETYDPIAQRWFVIHAYPSPNGLALHFNDITEWKQVEGTLQANQTQLQRLVEANIVGIIVSTMAGQVLEANDIFLSLVGYTREELLAGQLSWRAMTPPEYLPAHEQAIQELREQGACKPFEKVYITKEGKRVPVLLIGVRLEETSDRCLFFVLDIAEQKDLEKQRELLVGVIGHELRTPLTAIKGNLQLAQRRFHRYIEGHQNQPTKDSSSLAKIETSLEQAHRQIRVQERLINDLLESTRIADGTLTVTLQPCDLLSIIHDTVEDVRFTRPERELLLDLPAEEIVSINADADRIGQVLANYILNAFKYSPEETPVKIGMNIEEHEVRVWVQDYGPGIPLASQQRVWDRFYRLSTATEHGEKTGKSFGLGLHVCQALIKEHSGKVGVESSPGQGSTFWFSLPRPQ
jgi:PAS domain S-box-containing protein